MEKNIYKLSKWSLENLNDLSIIEKEDIVKLDKVLDKEYNEEMQFLNVLALIIGEDKVFSNRETFIKYSNPEKYYAEEDDENELPPSDIVAYTELRSCADLIRLYDSGKGKLVIQPDFQRDVVWDKASQTRFIDSLTKQLPIPSLCFSLDYRTQKRLVIDGLQRIKSIINFLTDENWRLSKLDDIDENLGGKRVSDIKRDNPELFEIVENVTIPITVLRCDYSKSDHNSYLFTIFHRLNSGGKKLTNQEIRNCIYHGTFNDLLMKNVNNKKFRKILNLKDNKGYRFKYEEYILRFYAFLENYKSYTGGMAKFLNTYMLKNKNLKDTELEKMKLLFDETVELIFERISNKKQLKISNTVFEALMIGVASNKDKLKKSKADLSTKFNKMIDSPEFTEAKLRGGLANKERVHERIDRAIKVFS